MDNPSGKSRIDKVADLANEQLIQYKQDLADLKNEKDVVTRDFKRNRIHDTYREAFGFSTKDIETHIRAALAPPPLDLKVRYTLKEIIQAYSEPDSWIIPKILFGNGLYMLAAEPKAGKSLLLYDMAYGFCISGKFLGLPCKKGKVILYQCEEPTTTIVRRFQSRGFQDNDQNFEEANDNLLIMRQFSLSKDLEKLAQVIDDEKPDVLMFDSLRAITSDVDTSENCAEFSKYLYALQRLLVLKEVCGIVVHHGNKSGGVSGSLSMIGAVDGLIFLKADKETGGTHRRLTTTPRNGSHVDLRIDRTCGEGGRWNFTMLEDLSTDEETQLVQQKILRWFSKTPGTKISKSDICLGTGLDVKDREVEFALSQLCDDMILNSSLDKATRTFLYSLPTESVWTTAFTPDKTTDTPEELAAQLMLDKEGLQFNNVGEAFLGIEAKLANKLTEATNIEEIKELSNSVESDTWAKAWDLLMPDEQQRLIRLRYAPTLIENDTLMLDGNEHAISQVKYDFDSSYYRYVLDDGTPFTQEQLDSILQETEVTEELSTTPSIGIPVIKEDVIEEKETSLDEVDFINFLED